MNPDRELALTQPMGKLFLRMAIPGIIGTVVMGLYNFVGAIFLGQLESLRIIYASKEVNNV